MKKITLTLVAGALLATSGVALAQRQEGRRGPDAQLTRDEAVARAEQRFARLDANRDGRLTAEEARQGRPARAERRQARRGDRQGQRGELAFERLDTNRDGQISREEFNQRRALRGDRGAQRGERRAARAERRAGRGFGQDGVVTLAEFRARALQRFERLDANRDGIVTVAERQEVRQRIRAERQGRRSAPQQN